jgi:hypothetical protein
LEKWIFLLLYKATGHSQEWGRLARLVAEDYARPVDKVDGPAPAGAARNK